MVLGGRTGGIAQAEDPAVGGWSLQRLSGVVGPLGAVAAALALNGVLLLALGVNPLFAYKSMVAGAIGSGQSLGDTLNKTVPIALIALGLGLTFRCGLCTVGGEGQSHAGATGAALVATL